MTDDLDDLLSPRPADTSVGVREAVFRRTERRLAFARRVREFVRVAGVAAVFAVGIWVGWVAKPERAVPEPVAPEVIVVPVVVPVPQNPGVNTPGSPELVRSARDLDLLAEQTDDAADAAKLYRAAGDKYLDDMEDYVNAARCYRQFLARAGDTALSPIHGDSWLLTSLKNAAFKEKLDVSKTDGE